MYVALNTQHTEGKFEVTVYMKTELLWNIYIAFPSFMHIPTMAAIVHHIMLCAIIKEITQFR